MPAYHVERSVDIAKAPSAVRPLIEDYAQWPTWSPWLYFEQDTKLSYQGEAGQIGHGYSWEGPLTGVGGMELLRATDSRMEMALTFIKPFKSKAKVAFDITPCETPDGPGTRVTWHMDGKLPFFMFFMVNTMKGMIGADYGRGLAMLKDLAETGAVPSRAEVTGVTDVDGLSYVGVRQHTQ